MEENGQESVNQNKQLVGVSQSKKSTGYKPANQTNIKPDLTNQDSMQALSQPISAKCRLGASQPEQCTGKEQSRGYESAIPGKVQALASQLEQGLD